MCRSLPVPCVLPGHVVCNERQTGNASGCPVYECLTSRVKALNNTPACYHPIPKCLTHLHITFDTRLLMQTAFRINCEPLSVYLQHFEGTLEPGALFVLLQ